MRKIVLNLVLVVGLLFGCTMNIAAQDVTPIDKFNQTISGLETKLPKGKLVGIKVSALPRNTEGEVTALYKIALLENGHVSDNYKILTRSEKNIDNKDPDSVDMIFAIKCQDGIVYQVLFGVTYIEIKKGTKEVLHVFNGPIKLYPVLVDDSNPDPPNPPNPPSNVVFPESDFGLIRVAGENALKVKLPKDKLKLALSTLSKTEAGLASKIAAGVIKPDLINNRSDVEVFLIEVKKENNADLKSVEIEPTVFDVEWGNPIEAALKQLFKDGKLKTLNDYMKAWSEIASGLDLAARSIK